VSRTYTVVGCASTTRSPNALTILRPASTWVGRVSVVAPSTPVVVVVAQATTVPTDRGTAAAAAAAAAVPRMAATTTTIAARRGDMTTTIVARGVTTMSLAATAATTAAVRHPGGGEVTPLRAVHRVRGAQPHRSGTHLLPGTTITKPLFRDNLCVIDLVQRLSSPSTTFLAKRNKQEAEDDLGYAPHF
jgi:hypothetical protein